MSAQTKKLTPSQRLMAAMQRYAHAQGEASWLSGYRAAKGGEFAASPEGRRLYEKEKAYYGEADRAGAAFQRLAQRLTRGAK